MLLLLVNIIYYFISCLNQKVIIKTLILNKLHWKEWMNENIEGWPSDGFSLVLLEAEVCNYAWLTHWRSGLNSRRTQHSIEFELKLQAKGWTWNDTWTAPSWKTWNRWCTDKTMKQKGYCQWSAGASVVHRGQIKYNVWHFTTKHYQLCQIWMTYIFEEVHFIKTTLVCSSTREIVIESITTFKFSTNLIPTSALAQLHSRHARQEQIWGPKRPQYMNVESCIVSCSLMYFFRNKWNNYDPYCCFII